MHRLSNLYQKDTNTGNLDLVCPFIQKPHDFLIMIRDAKRIEQADGLKLSRRTTYRALFVEWHIVELFSGLIARHILMYVGVPSFWRAIERLP